MNSYNRNKNKELKNPFINPNNEIKISENTDVHESINFISDLFLKQNYNTIYISGLNKAIKKVVLITEIIKSKIPGLHQITNINSLESNKNDESVDNKIIPRLSITLTFIEPSEEEKKDLGYQKPISIGLISELSKIHNSNNNY